MPSISKLAATIATLSVFAAQSNAAPLKSNTTIIRERQEGLSAIFDIIIDGIAGESTGEFNTLFSAPPACAWMFEDGDNYHIIVGQDPVNGNYWQTCWMDDQDYQVWGANEVTVADCLVNLHYTQADTCISVAGSVCDGYIDGGYIGTGGRVQNLRNPYWGSGYQSDAQLSGDQSGSLQLAVAAINGQNVRGTGAKGPFFVLTGADGTFPVSTLDTNWIGELTC